MCGLAGLLRPADRDADLAPADICAAMIDTLRHRGPDDGGVWADAAAGVAIGLRRLAVIDLSPAGHQPMVSASERYVIALNGEIYNFQELRDDLEARGIAFRGRSDTEVLLEAIGVWGFEPTIQRANGMFAVAVWDRKDRVLRLARDRLGQKPLYYGWTGRAFVFGSELKAIEAVPEFSPSIDRGALTLYLRHGYVPEPTCIWAGLQKLPPGTTLTITAQDCGRRIAPEPVRYWNVREVVARGAADPIREEGAALEALDTLLRDAVRLCMVSDVPLGAFLSGGIDSSTVVALMQSQSGRKVRTFSIGFLEPGFDEAAHAKAVARHLGTDHTELYVTEPDALAIIPSLPTVYDEPFADSSQIPTFLLSRLVRRDVTVSLSGDGGDELFGGYNRHVWARNLEFGMRVPAALRGVAARAVKSVPAQVWDAAAGVLPRRLRYRQAGEKAHKLAGVIGASSRAGAYRRLTSIWQEPDAILLRPGEKTDSAYAPAGWPEVAGFAEGMMLLDTETYLPGDILTKVDRASMAVSLESRMPILDHRVVELSWRVPLSMKLRGGTSKWLLRQLLDRHVPQDLVERPKAGFAIPLGAWLRGPLRSWAEDLLTESRLRADGYFHPQPIRQAWKEHLSGRGNRQEGLWAILMFQEWLRRPKPGRAAVSASNLALQGNQ